jgi:RNA recognition motif-containing protein
MQLLGGRTVRVNFPEVPRGGERTVAAEAVARTSLRVVDDGTYKVYAGNLGWGVRADALKAAFEGQPGLVGSRVIFERDTGRSRGFGFLSFQTLEDANAAIQAMDGVVRLLAIYNTVYFSTTSPCGITTIQLIQLHKRTQLCKIGMY